MVRVQDDELAEQVPCQSVAADAVAGDAEDPDVGEVDDEGHVVEHGMLPGADSVLHVETGGQGAESEAQAQVELVAHPSLPQVGAVAPCGIQQRRGIRGCSQPVAALGGQGGGQALAGTCTVPDPGRVGLPVLAAGAGPVGQGGPEDEDRREQAEEEHPRPEEECEEPGEGQREQHHEPRDATSAR